MQYNSIEAFRFFHYWADITCKRSQSQDLKTPILVSGTGEVIDRWVWLSRALSGSQPQASSSSSSSPHFYPYSCSPTSPKTERSVLPSITPSPHLFLASKDGFYLSTPSLQVSGDLSFWFRDLLVWFFLFFLLFRSDGRCLVGVWRIGVSILWRE